MKKLIAKIFIYLLILLFLPYSYLVWQAKQGVDVFLLTHDFGAEVSYQWLTVNLDGTISLHDFMMAKKRQEAIFTAESIDIIPSSIFDLVDAREHIIHNEYPNTLSVNINNATSSAGNQLVQIFGLDFNPEYLDYIYPSECRATLLRDIPTINFDASSNFVIQRTADISEVDFKVRSLEFSNINGSFKVNNFSEGAADGSFVSDFSIAFFDIAWLQQNTQRCLVKLDMQKQAFRDAVVDQIGSTANSKNIVFDEQVPTALAEFLFVPQRIELAFDIEEGMKFSQILSLPIYQIPEKLGLALKLNQQPVNVVFNQLESQQASLEVEPLDPLNLEENPAPVLSNTALRSDELKGYLGAKLLLELHNGRFVDGYLESVDRQSLMLLQRKFKGKSVAPFAFKDIKKISLVLAEK